jgi:curved DNA-binding protein CbpA
MDLARDEISQAYQELDLAPGASWAEVKAAYRRLARALHPDLNPGAAGGLMARVNRAYRILEAHLAARPASDAGPERGSARRGRDWRPYRYEEFSAGREAHGEHARRHAAWARRREAFYRQAQAAAESAVHAAAQAAAAPRDDRAASPAPARQSRPPARPAGRERTAAGGPAPEGAGRLVGLSRAAEGRVYQVEISGRPRELTLPVRCCRACPACGGGGLEPDGRRRCPSCGGRGSIVKADRTTVALPAAWSPGQRLPVPGAGGEAIWVELMPGREA